MTLQKVVTDIQDLARQQLAALGLTVVPETSDDPSLEDHSVKFRDARGRAHAVSVQVNSYSPSLTKSSLSIEHVELKPIEDTRFSCMKSGWSHERLRSNSSAGRVEEIIAAIRANNWFVPIDDLEAGIVTDFRWETVIPKMREHFFDGDVRLSSSTAGAALDIVEILNDGKVTAKAAFTGQAIIRISYDTLAGEERVLEYNGLARFEENIDKDLGGTPTHTMASGPRM